MSDLSINRISPVIDFTSLDFDAIKADLEAYAQSKYADRWTDFNENQFAVVFLEMVAYLGDLLSYHLDASIREAFAATVVRRQNMINIGKTFDVVPDPAEASSVSMRITLDPAGVYPFTLTRADNQFSNGSTTDEVYFQPATDTVVAAYPGPGYVDVDCLEGEYFENIIIGVSNNLPAQQWQFPQQGVVLSSVVLKVGAATWTLTKNFINSLSTNQHYKLIQNDDGSTFAVFGDGIFGAVPALGQQITATFRIGGGRRGNLAKNTIETVVSSHANVLSVTNPSGSSGGTDAQGMKEARRAIPNSLSTLERGVTLADYAALAVLVAGVEKAYAKPAYPAGARKISVIIAPAGGGDPTDVLKNSVLTALGSKKMVTNRLRVYGPDYRDIRLHVLLHANSGFRGSDVEAVTRNSIVNSDGTGLYDFSQLDFGGVDQDGELLFSQTRLQDHFATLKLNGLDRAELLKFDVDPVAVAREAGNTGTGTITGITLNGRQRRRQFLVQLISSTQAIVYERIVGLVSAITDTVLQDDTRAFEDEVVSYTGFTLQPDTQSVIAVAVASAVGTDVTVASSLSLFSMTEVGNEYAIYNPVGTALAVGGIYTSADGSTQFQLNAGVTSFINGDSFTIDVYPNIGDIVLKANEYPRLTDANFVTRISGGAKI